MLLRCFTIPALDPERASAEVSAFLSNHRVLTCDRQLVACGPDSFWAICITYTSAADSRDTPTKRTPKDYRELLSEPDFAVFARLRTLRKQISERDEVPAYAIFTNEHLATMVRDRVTTPTALAALAGVGQARVERHGEAFLAILRESQAPAPTHASA